MARHQENSFHESESLNIPNPILPEEEESAGQAAVSVNEAPAEEIAEGPSSPAENGEAEEEIPAGETEERAEKPPETPAEEPPEDDLDEDDDSDASILQERARIADDAWDDEARRVDADEPGKARKAWEEEDRRKRGEAGEEEEKPGKAKAKKRKKKKKSRKKKATDDRHIFLKTIAVILVCGFLFLTATLLVVSNFIEHPLLAMPRQIISSVVSPVQRFFSNVTDSVVDYLRMLKIRGEIEYQYEQLTLLLDDYATMGAQNEEYRRTIQELYSLLDEQDRNRDLNPLAASVVLTDSGNYFSTLSLDVGSENGVDNYMAVVAQGGLVAFPTETVYGLRCGKNHLQGALHHQQRLHRGRPHPVHPGPGQRKGHFGLHGRTHVPHVLPAGQLRGPAGRHGGHLRRGPGIPQGHSHRRGAGKHPGHGGQQILRGHRAHRGFPAPGIRNGVPLPAHLCRGGPEPAGQLFGHPGAPGYRPARAYPVPERHQRFPLLPGARNADDPRGRDLRAHRFAHPRPHAGRYPRSRGHPAAG